MSTFFTAKIMVALYKSSELYSNIEIVISLANFYRDSYKTTLKLYKIMAQEMKTLH